MHLLLGDAFAVHRSPVSHINEVFVNSSRRFPKPSSSNEWDVHVCLEAKAQEGRAFQASSIQTKTGCVILIEALRNFYLTVGG